MIQPGKPAPDFFLPDVDMDVFHLSREKGKRNVVLTFLPRTGTPCGLQQAEQLAALEDDLGEFDSCVLGVTPEDGARVARLRDENDLSLRILCDEDAEVCRLYDLVTEREDGRLSVERATFIIDKAGVIRYLLREANAQEHAAHVMEFLTQLQRGKKPAASKKTSGRSGESVHVC